MGFSTLIDILGSTIVGGMLFMILLRINDAAVENTFTYGSDLLVQQNLVSAVELLEYDFRKIGYCKDWAKIPDPTKAILEADSTSIKFLTDVAVSAGVLDGDGVVDTLRYYLGPASELTNTGNPRDRILYRQVNKDTPLGANLGITRFKLDYFNALGDTIKTYPVPVPGEIYTLKIDLIIENTFPIISSINGDSVYTVAFWRQIRLAARNIRNR